MKQLSKTEMLFVRNAIKLRAQELRSRDGPPTDYETARLMVIERICRYAYETGRRSFDYDRWFGWCNEVFGVRAESQPHSERMAAGIERALAELAAHPPRPTREKREILHTVAIYDKILEKLEA